MLKEENYKNKNLEDKDNDPLNKTEPLRADQFRKREQLKSSNYSRHWAIYYWVLVRFGRHLCVD
jgi:hypothetical protein